MEVKLPCFPRKLIVDPRNLGRHLAAIGRGLPITCLSLSLNNTTSLDLKSFAYPVLDIGAYAGLAESDYFHACNRSSNQISIWFLACYPYFLLIRFVVFGCPAVM